MFVVTIDIWPHGRVDAQYPALKIAAANEGTSGTRQRGNYRAWNVTGVGDDQAIYNYVFDHYDEPHARVTNFPRKHTQEHLASLTTALFGALGLNEITAAPEEAA